MSVGQEYHPSVRGTGLLLALLAALIGYLWLFELRPRWAAAPAEPEAPALLPVAPGTVARVELVDQGRKFAALRRGAEWTDPNGEAWRGEAVADLIVTLGALRPVMVVDPHPHEPGDYGLGANARRLEVAAADGAPLLTLELGERNPAGTGLYARRAGQQEVLLVGAVLSWELDKLRGAAPSREP